jgi:hypothetical protein
MSFIISRYVQNDSGDTLFDGVRHAVVQDMGGPGSPYSDPSLAEKRLLEVQQQFSIGVFRFRFGIREIADKPVPPVIESPKLKTYRHPFGHLEIPVDTTTAEEDQLAGKELQALIETAVDERAELQLTDTE